MLDTNGCLLKVINPPLIVEYFKTEIIRRTSFLCSVTGLLSVIYGTSPLLSFPLCRAGDEGKKERAKKRSAELQ